MYRCIAVSMYRCITVSRYHGITVSRYHGGDGSSSGPSPLPGALCFVAWAPTLAEATESIEPNGAAAENHRGHPTGNLRFPEPLTVSRIFQRGRQQEASATHGEGSAYHAIDVSPYRAITVSRYRVCSRYHGGNGSPFSSPGALRFVARPPTLAEATEPTGKLRFPEPLTVSPYRRIALSMYHRCIIDVSRYHGITVSRYRSVTVSRYHGITPATVHLPAPSAQPFSCYRGIVLSRYRGIAVSCYRGGDGSYSGSVSTIDLTV
jgi:hypothetical protein